MFFYTKDFDALLHRRGVAECYWNRLQQAKCLKLTHFVKI